MTFPQFVAEANPVHRGLWEGVYRLAKVPVWATVAEPTEPRNFLALAEDWCGDAVNTLPNVARWVERVSVFDLRLLRRDEHPGLMDRYCTDGARSIPIVIALDPAFRELGHWGPRPRELQQWVMANRATIPKEERYKQVRRWYAADRGQSTIREIMQAAGLPTPPP
jgi:Thioredoxin